MNNILRFKQLLSEKGIDGAFISSPNALKYLLNYSTGSNSEVSIGTFSDSSGFAYIPASNKKAYFIADPRYEGIKLDNFIEPRILRGNGKKSYLEFVLDVIKSSTKHPNLIGIEKTGLNYLEGSKFVRSFASQKIKTIAVDDLILSLRSIKSKEEIEKIINAQKITDSVFTKILNYIKPGKTEVEIADFIEQEIKAQNGELSFESIVASGSNSATPHHLNSNKKLLKNDIVLLDFGAKLGNYHSDMSRTVFLGKPPKSMIDDYSRVLDNMIKIEMFIKINKNIKEITQYSRKLFNSFGDSSYSNFHSLGHGVGIQIHESPSFSERNQLELVPGNIVTIEPGVYRKGEYGIRVEDMLLIGSKITNLTKSLKSLTVLH